MKDTEKCQVIKCKCGKIYGGAVAPYCYTDKDWLKEMKQALLKDGHKIDLISADDFKFEKCTCGNELFNQGDCDDLAIGEYDDRDSNRDIAIDRLVGWFRKRVKINDHEIQYLEFIMKEYHSLNKNK